MSFDLHQILESKRALRQQLAALPVGDKLRLLDVMRERELAIRSRLLPGNSSAGLLRERPAPYRTKPN